MREEGSQAASAEAAAAAEAHARRVAEDTAQLDSLRTEFRCYNVIPCRSLDDVRMIL